MIDKLTKEQESKISYYLDKFLKIGLSTEKCDRVKAEDAITRAYTYQKLSAPKFIWVDSPFEGIVKAAKLAKGSDDVTNAEIKDQVSKASYGSFEAYWVSFYSYIANELPVKKDELCSILEDIVENCGVYWTFESVVIISEKPTQIHMKDKKLHNENGLALEYSDGNGIFSLNGIRYKSMMDMIISNEASDSKK